MHHKLQKNRHKIITKTITQMRKIITLIAGLTFLCKTGISQYYYISNTSAHQNPGGICTDDEFPSGGGQVVGWTIILGPTVTTPTWSSQRTIPFAFQFNGNTVSNYKVSSTGILTFTTGATTVPSGTPATLPNADIPDNSVCIWGQAITGPYGIVTTKTFGTAPNRQHWVQFRTSTYTGQNSSYCYWSIVLEETSNNIYIVDQRSSGVAALTLGIQINATTACQVNGSPSIASVAMDDFTPVDNGYYTFIQGTQPANDIALTTINPAAGQIEWGVIGSNKTISGTIQNLGSAAITAFTAKYSYGALNGSSNFTGLNIASSQTYNFTITTPYTIAAGPHPANVWVELSGDIDHSNDTLKTQINGSSFLPARKVVYEEATGTWCGWCVRGIVYMDSIAKEYPNTVIPIAVHNGDPMKDNTYDAGMGGVTTEYPSVLVDRSKKVGNPSKVFTYYNKHINDFGWADLSVTTNYNATTRVANVSVDTKVAFTLNNNNSAVADYRLAVVFAEDNVTGSGSGYNQENYYSGGANGSMQGAGHNFAIEPEIIPAADMEYDFVARTILGGFSGQANSLPNSMTDGSTYTNNFTYTLPVGYKENNMKVHALLIDAKNGIILNGATALHTVGIRSVVAPKPEFTIYPNPVQNTLNIDLNVDDADNVTVAIMNSIGETIQMKQFGKTNGRKNHLSIDVSTLPAGVYFISVNTGKAIAAGKFIK